MFDMYQHVDLFINLHSLNVCPFTLFILEIVLKTLPVKFRLTSEVVDYSPLNNSVNYDGALLLRINCNLS